MRERVGNELVATLPVVILAPLTGIVRITLTESETESDFPAGGGDYVWSVVLRKTGEDCDLELVGREPMEVREAVSRW